MVRWSPVKGSEAPEATGGGTRVLDAISGPLILSAPSGWDYRNGRRRDGSTWLSTNSRPPDGAVHDLSTAVDGLWTMSRQPPIANISTFGKVDVAAERSSE